jgi:streptomycin 6-kinase
MSPLLTHYQEKWNLKNLSELCQTPRGKLYRCQQADNQAVLKIYTGMGVNEERRGVDFLRATKGFGVVDILESDEKAVLLEYCDGPTLDHLVGRGEDDLACKIIAGLIKKLHACPLPEEHQFISLEKRFYPLASAAKYSKEYGKTFSKAHEMARSFVSEQKNISLLHGDIHHYNIIQHNEKGWVMIDPKGCVGESAYDLANVFLNPWERSSLVRDDKRVSRRAAIFEEYTGVSQKKILKYAFVEACLSQAWFLEEGESSDHALAMMAILGLLV